MPTDRESEQSPKIDREHSVFKVQKADVERQLGELRMYADDILKSGAPNINFIHGRANFIKIISLDIQAVLENMEEGECERCDGTGRIRVYLTLEDGTIDMNHTIDKPCPSCGASMEGE